MNIGFVGAGKVGFTLGRYFAEKGMTVKGYYSRRRESSEAAAQFTDSVVYDSCKELLIDCDVIFITVPDGSIAEVFKQLSDYPIKGKTICHCSGSMSAADAFEGIAEAGAFGYSIHPLFAVSDKYNAYRELTGVFFTIEGDTKSQEGAARMDMLRMFIESLGNPVSVVEAENKTAYHCAAAIASNLICGLVDQSIELLGRCGFEEKDAVRALAPILTGNMRHVASKGPEESLTGPVERNDIHTVKKHLECLADDSERELYSLLTARLVRMARRRHPDRDYTEMSTLIGNELKK